MSNNVNFVHFSLSPCRSASWTRITSTTTFFSLGLQSVRRNESIHRLIKFRLRRGPYSPRSRFKPRRSPTPSRTPPTHSERWEPRQCPEKKKITRRRIFLPMTKYFFETNQNRFQILRQTSLGLWKPQIVLWTDPNPAPHRPWTTTGPQPCQDLYRTAVELLSTLEMTTWPGMRSGWPTSCWRSWTSSRRSHTPPRRWRRSLKIGEESLTLHHQPLRKRWHFQTLFYFWEYAYF